MILYENTRCANLKTTTTKWPIYFSFALPANIQWNFTEKFLAWLQKYNKVWLFNNNNSNNKMADLLFCFKKLLLWNYLPKFNETWEKASLHDPLHKYNKVWLFNNNNSNKMADLLFCFKKLLLWNYLPKIQWNFTESFLAWLQKILVAIQQQQQQNGWLDFFSFEKISETTGQNSMKLERKLLCMPLQKYKRLHYWSSATDRVECKEKETWVKHITCQINLWCVVLYSQMI